MCVHACVRAYVRAFVQSQSPKLPQTNDVMLIVILRGALGLRRNIIIGA